MAVIECGSLLTLVVQNVWKPVWLLLHNTGTTVGACMFILLQYWCKFCHRFVIEPLHKWNHILVERSHSVFNFFSTSFGKSLVPKRCISNCKCLSANDTHAPAITNFFATFAQQKQVVNSTLTIHQHFKLICWPFFLITHAAVTDQRCYLFGVFLVILNQIFTFF